MAALHECDHGALLAPDATSADQTSSFLFRGNPDLINFHDAAQFVDHAMLRHCEAQTMAHEPNRLVRDAKHPVNLMGRHAVVAGVHEVGRQKPTMKRYMAVLKY